MPECPNAGKKLVRHRHFFRKSIASVRHRHSGIRVSPEALATDESGIVQLCLFALVTEFFLRGQQLIPWPFDGRLFLEKS